MKVLSVLCLIISAVGHSSSCAIYTNKNVSLTTLTIYNKNHGSGIPLGTGTIIQDTDIFVLAHEFLFDSNVEWVVETRPNLLRLYPDANVVVIDYSPYSNNPLYVPNACTSPYVGQLAADNLIALNADPNLISCTGHSMGAQVCGAFGRRFVEKNKGKIARITGMDAAGPGYDNKNYLMPLPVVDHHISKADAKRVVGIYTDSNGLGFGMNQNPVHSHISIIVNAGYEQPGCKKSLTCPKPFIGRRAIEACVVCSHRFSKYLYKDAMNGKKYKLTLCNDYNDYIAGKCKKHRTFIYTEKLDASVTDGIYHIRINSNYDQIAYNAP